MSAAEASSAPAAAAASVARCDVAVVGGGIVGLATALALVERGRRSVVVLEAESEIAAHQTGHNSGVIHSGLYYKPGSLKARQCVAGRTALYSFCGTHGIAHERCGKVVVATTPGELEALAALEQRGHDNGLVVRRVDADELRELEPEATGVAALHVADTGIVDYRQVAAVYAREVARQGGEVRTGWPVRQIAVDGDGHRLRGPAGELNARLVVNCGGLQSDRLARLCGVVPDVRIIPFRGDYYELVLTRRNLVRNLVYPVPDPRYPFLGVHFTRMVDGGVEVGPNAVLALRRGGYKRYGVSLRDTLDTLTWPGFWRLVGRHWRTGMGEMRRTASRRAFAAAARRLVPAVVPADLRWVGCGIRAQAIDRQGNLVDDFAIVQGERSVHVLNAPSPAATASLAIGRTIATLAEKRLG